MNPRPDPDYNVVLDEGVRQQVTEEQAAQDRRLQQERALAIAQERERLARELHDSLGQVLGYVVVQGQAAHELLARGQVDQADALMERLVAVAREAHSDVRANILALKAATTDCGLLPALEHHLHQLERDYGLHTDLVVPEGLLPSSDACVEVQLLRIIQEALTNVRKHSGSRDARVTFRVDPHGVQVAIEDSGRGFDPAAGSLHVGGQAFGLQVMRERAEEIGGSLELDSTPGRGTRVVVRIPSDGEATSES